MGHPAVDNRTGFAFQPLFILDEQARPVVTAVVKGTFAIGADGRCLRAEQQLPVEIEGVPWGPDPALSSYRYEPEVAFVKPTTDVVMNGHAVAPRAGVAELLVGLRVGQLQKQVQVLGDRVWWKSLGQVAATKPRPFERIPLRWERAFGGWDRSAPDPLRHTCEPRNPVGVGMRPSRHFEEGLRLPNLEDPQQLLKRFGDAPPPAGFGFVAPHWQPRAALAGTYDERWQKERSPLLPKNFDRRHLNAAAPGLLAPAYLRGDEAVIATGVVPEGTLRFSLPAVRPPAIRVALRDGNAPVAPTNLDTVIIEPDERRLLLLWRACVPLRTGPHDVRAIEVLESLPAGVR
jgi:hypothetical protein